MNHEAHNDPDTVARHEAVHVVIGEAFGKRLQYVCAGGALPQTRVVWLKGKSLDHPDEEAVISLAGPILDDVRYNHMEPLATDYLKVLGLFKRTGVPQTIGLGLHS